MAWPRKRVWPCRYFSAPDAYDPVHQMRMAEPWGPSTMKKKRRGRDNPDGPFTRMYIDGATAQKGKT